MKTNLNNCPIKSLLTIEQISSAATPECQRRLMQHGLVVGSTVKILQRDWGLPLLIEIRDVVMAIGKEESRFVEVKDFSPEILNKPSPNKKI